MTPPARRRELHFQTQTPLLWSTVAVNSLSVFYF
ncbi:hypothetical protein BVRB_012170 [Beta vulgaris subsp. vulgaris]|uniref:Uncharacterized protein n=1 Tax=Beta vulgaris subsp. vulgaris TaxID=3555 RepID=A0A0J8B2B1_BETVV|nr:hypothetical protein BVRB_012170 [Beta vulgaris subsp. vulgaris]